MKSGGVSAGPAWWAAIEHHRTWLAADGCYRREIEASGLTPELARHIAREYRVARTIGAVDADGSGIGQLVEAIKSSPWPDELEDRAKRCKEIADEHKEKSKEHGQGQKWHAPVSAVTKLMWFLRPDGWTMFDRFARMGLIGHQNNPLEFYRKLASIDFTPLCDQLHEMCRRQGFPYLYGERIVDKCLMYLGAGDSSEYVRTSNMINRHYLELLPQDAAERLRRLADTAGALLEQALIPKCFVPRPIPHKPSKGGSDL